MIWVYALCDRPEVPLPREEGFEQAPLEGIAEGEMLAVVSRHEHAPSAPGVDVLWMHERVVERLMDDRAVLPMRFGTKLPDDDAVRSAMRARHDELVGRLDAVRGRVELGLRAMAPTGESPPAEAAADGRAYLMAKLERSERAQQAARALHEPLRELAVDAREQTGREAGEVLRAAYLVDRENVPRFRSAVEHLQDDNPGVGLLCTGPWPPYSFTASG